MVYNNLILRLFFSTIFIIVYLIFLYINFNYIFYLVFLIYVLVFIEIYFYFKNYKFLVFIYVLSSFLFFINLQFSEEIILNFNLFILIVISFDTFCYIIGKNFGHKKLIQISPNKTYEGLLGGIIISLLLSLLFSYFFRITINFELIIFVFLIIISAFIGDLIESFFKRRNNLKNSSKFIPGHGGVFDRFDSFIFSIVIYSIFTDILL